MTMRSDWKEAKKTCSKRFDEAYANWLRTLEKKKLLGDPKAKKQYQTELLKQIGLEMGAAYGSAPTFNSADLGPTLDKIEAIVTKAETGLVKLTVEQILKNKTLRAFWKQYADKRYVAENYNFLTAGYKQDYQTIYDDYVIGAQQLNLGAPLRQLWDNANNQGLAKNQPGSKIAKKLIKPTVKEIMAACLVNDVKDIQNGSVLPETTKNFRIVLGGTDVHKLIAKARKACMSYAKISQAYGKRWSKIKPDFWTPINQSLDNILGNLADIEKQFKP